MSERSFVSPPPLLIHLLLGDREQALALLKKAYAINDGWLVWLGVEPTLDALRGEPAFDELLSRTRNPAVKQDKLYESPGAFSGARTTASCSHYGDAPITVYRRRRP